MKKISYPPLIILLDVLFVFLFILILNSSSKVIKIIPPSDKLFENGKILIWNEQIKKYYSYPDKTPFRFDTKFTQLLKCKNQKECLDIKATLSSDEKAYILLPDKLFNEISKLSLVAFDEKSCKNLVFHIGNNGKLNKEELISSNSCLLKINGFQKYF